MVRNEELALPLVSLDHIIPPLAKIAFHVRYRRPFDEGMRIMPVMWSGVFRIAAERRGIVMQVRIPAVEVTFGSNHHVDAAHEGRQCRPPPRSF